MSSNLIKMAIAVIDSLTITIVNIAGEEVTRVFDCRAVQKKQLCELFLYMLLCCGGFRHSYQKDHYVQCFVKISFCHAHLTLVETCIP
ncbi:hypothetical protein [Desulfomonile tiedjei]|uniref:Uncharacterized protein n=1 Tax=Desulfomonile tiedjei (strain ATCC 49306 / DSM 6799 / DCB-1) TaxID=706587 RepID=I4C961_DESTA|nr:hypothetical protein [Desulfomonile tiedjei]AFM26102.1 hypothetical protein Desti_3450 [Desulfomonile tiedjei DSM 6799]